MKRPDIDGIRQRSEAATEGPWQDAMDGIIQIYSKAREFICGHLNPNDAEFIANARQDIPVLLAYIEELEKREVYAKPEMTKIESVDVITLSSVGITKSYLKEES